MLVSGFVDGKIIFIIEFQFNSNNFIAKLQQQLQKKFLMAIKKGLI